MHRHRNSSEPTKIKPNLDAIEDDIQACGKAFALTVLGLGFLKLTEQGRGKRVISGSLERFSIFGLIGIPLLFGEA